MGVIVKFALYGVLQPILAFLVYVGVFIFPVPLLGLVALLWAAVTVFYFLALRRMLIELFRVLQKVLDSYDSV